MRGSHLGLSCTQPDPIPVRTEATLPNCTMVAFLFNIMRSRTSSARDAFSSLLHSTRSYTSPHRGHATKLRWWPSFFNIMRSITSSARDAFRSLLHSFRTSTSLHGGRATKLYGGGLPSFLILCAQERAVRGTHLGPSCTRPDHIPIRTEATLPNYGGSLPF